MALDDTIKALEGAFRYPLPYGYACVGRVEGDDRLVFAFHPHQDVFTAVGDLVSLPAVHPAAATLFPLVETALQVTLDAGAGYRDRVLVLGAGVVGLLTALLLQRCGRRPLCAEPLAWRRDLAASLGVTTAAPAELGKEDFPLVIDARGDVVVRQQAGAATYALPGRKTSPCTAPSKPHVVACWLNWALAITSPLTVSDMYSSLISSK